jgi:hypothetical protein
MVQRTFCEMRRQTIAWSVVLGCPFFKVGLCGGGGQVSQKPMVPGRASGLRLGLTELLL